MMDFHYHHSHGPGARHEGDHHLLQVEGLTVSFRMYEHEEPTERAATEAPAATGTPAAADAETPSARFGATGPLCRLARAARRTAAFFSARQREVSVVRDLHVSVHAGEVVAVVGASGSGKTLLADSVLGLFEPNARVTGTIWFDGVRQDAASLARLRGHGISLVPQSVASLDPIMRVGDQVRGACSRAQLPERIARQRRLFERYGLGPEVERMYPFELSGGMARRVLLCCALMDEPRLIIADEPTPGLDLDLAMTAMRDFRDFADDGGGVLLVTHDIELALRVCDRVAVFRDGTVVEETAVGNFALPELLRHPFSRQLWHALPEHGFVAPGGEGDAPALEGPTGGIRGASPDATDGGSGACSDAAAGEPADRDGLAGKEGSPC